MKLFYLQEHVSCCRYATPVQEGCRHARFSEGSVYEEEAKTDCILFVLKGKLHFFCQGYDFLLPAGTMTFFHRGSFIKIQALEEADVVMALFEGNVQACHKFSLQDLSKVRASIEYQMKPLEIRDRLQKYLELMVSYLDDKASCILFHEIKLKELFWLFRFYYTKRELASFFYMIISDAQDFRNKVLANYKRYRTVKELAEGCGYSLSAFKRHFMNEFGEAAGEWLQKQLVGEIKYKLRDTALSLGEIAYELDFSSLSQFSKYCRRCLGTSPTVLRKQLRVQR